MFSSTKSLEAKLVLFATILASAMAFLDGTVVSIAQADIQSKLHASFASLQWVTVAFALAIATLLIPSGSLGDRFGRRKVFSIGIAIFTLSSLLCAFSHSISQLITFRTIQGIGSAM